MSSVWYVDYTWNIWALNTTTDQSESTIAESLVISHIQDISTKAFLTAHNTVVCLHVCIIRFVYTVQFPGKRLMNSNTAFVWQFDNVCKHMYSFLAFLPSSNGLSLCLEEHIPYRLETLQPLCVWVTAGINPSYSSVQKQVKLRKSALQALSWGASEKKHWERKRNQDVFTTCRCIEFPTLLTSFYTSKKNYK